MFIILTLTILAIKMKSHVLQTSQNFGENLNFTKVTW